MLQLPKIFKIVQIICSASISNKSSKYFFKSFHIFVNFSQSQTFPEIPLIPSQKSSNFSLNFFYKFHLPNF